ncbi:glutathione S transferase-like protein [Euroglyphus maynei]|uniref:Glutathione S transferase-like protein n=1 Tax=Euroglyphus maynei TaxID=6958 RepID=A0A1Y3AW01_EURMA|nr:glutathione S transferase-like protein [Euroglyphus maynei]
MSESRPILYWMPESPPCRTVYVVAKMIDFKDFDVKLIDLTKLEQMSDDYAKINPFHTIPGYFEPPDFYLYESRTIARYLVEKYRPESSLYPLNDVRKRAIINRCMDYELGTLFRAMSDVILPIFKPGQGLPINEKLPRFIQVLNEFEKNLEKNQLKYLAGGSEMTLADLATYFTLIMCEAVPELIDLSKYPNIYSWLNRMGKFIKDLDHDGTLAKAQNNFCAYAQYCQQQAQQEEKRSE